MSDREKLLIDLKRYIPFDSHEKEMVGKVISLIENTPDCFHKNCFPAHITANAWIIDNGLTHLLFTHHKKLNKWLQLGGHADGEENLVNVAAREALEESGLKSVQLASPGMQLAGSGIFDVDIHEIPARKDTPAHYHYDVRYLFKVDKDEPLIVSDESHDLKWLYITEVPQYNNDRSILRMLLKSSSISSTY
ncbi:MAG: NUDIX hydrolase [uncultured bacterium]|nr:MAG: NUDIX hydrolase [uncultured bacterium]